MGKLIQVDGDLLKSDCTVIAHCCNCLSTMGAGIAKTIKQLYPEVYEADKNFRLPAKERLGHYSIALSAKKDRLFGNLYGQFNWKKKPGEIMTDYLALESALDRFLHDLNIAETKKQIPFPIKFGVPYRIGAGLAGGNWDTILDILQRMADKHERDIWIYKLPM